MVRRARSKEAGRTGTWPRSGLHLVTALVAALLVAGCGTRLDDAHIRAAAGVGETAGADGAGQTITGGLAPDGTTTGASTGGPVTDPGGSTGSPTGATPAGSGVTGTRSVAAGAGPATAAGGPARTVGGAAVAGNPVAAGGPAANSGPAGTAQAGGAAQAPAAGAPATQPAAGSPIVLGHIGDYSGLIGTLMKGGNVMAQVLARSINDHGGLDGHPVQVITGDAGGDPSRALSLARDMVENKGAVAFLGTLMVFSGYGPRDYLEERKIPVIGGDGTTAVWFQSPMYFPSAASFPSLSFGALKGLADLGKKKIALFHCVEAEQCKTWHDTAVAKASSVGAEIVYQAQVSLAQPDFTAECISAQRAGADGVMAGVDSPSVARLARACNQQGYKPQYMTASLAVIESTAKDPNLDGLMAPVGNFPHMADDIPAAKEYHAAIQQYAPGLVSSPAVAAVWTAGALLREVSKQLPDGKVTSADFLPGLYSIKDNTFGGLMGPLTLNEGAPASEVRCVFFIKVGGGRFTAPNGSKQQCF